MRRVLVLAIILSILSGSKVHASGTRVSGPGFDGVILDLPSTQKDVSVWVPGYDQIAEIEKALPAYVKKYIKAHKVVLRKPISKYKRQYVGVSENRKQLIGVSFYYDKLDFVTSKKWLNVVGNGGRGGDDYLGAVYDLEKKAYVLFEIYPEAKK
jgi:hypothetical protein